MPHGTHGNGFDLPDVPFIDTTSPPRWAMRDDVFWAIFAVMVFLTASGIAWVILSLFF